MDRKLIADLILEKIKLNERHLKECWYSTLPIRHIVVDDLLPEKIAHILYNKFPDSQKMNQKKTFREYKSISAQMDAYDPIIEEVLFAFHSLEIVNFVEKLTGLKTLEPDTLLYAGGISMMGEGNYLNPHLDNSHNLDQSRYRALNLLYYCSPDWQLDNGGNLELWPNGIGNEQITIESKFNRLVIMETHQSSWHSVSPVKKNVKRCCISNYYFTQEPPNQISYNHITKFRARPGNFVQDLILQLDAGVRGIVRKVKPSGLIKTKHYYRK